MAMSRAPKTVMPDRKASNITLDQRNMAKAQPHKIKCISPPLVKNKQDVRSPNTHVTLPEISTAQTIYALTNRQKIGVSDHP